MQVRVTRTRMAMSGQVYSYDVTVPADPKKERIITILDGGKHYLTFEDATINPDHWKMPQGWERYEDYQRHKRECRAPMLNLIQQAFPETAHLTEFPDLWIELPGFEASHNEVWL